MGRRRKVLHRIRDLRDEEEFLRKEKGILRVASWNIRRRKNTIKPVLEMINDKAKLDIVSIHEVDLVVGEDDENLLIHGFEQFSVKVGRNRGESGYGVEKIRTITYVREGLFDEIIQMEDCNNDRSECWLRLKNKGRRDLVYVGVYNEWRDGNPGPNNEDMLNQIKKRMSSDIFLHGDLNIDLDRVQDEDKTYGHLKRGREMIQEMERCGLDRHGSGITREEWKWRGGVKVLERSAIDWAATNLPGVQHFSKRIMADFSDHSMIISDLPYQMKGEKKTEKIRVRNINKLATDECIASLNMYHWESLATMTLEEMGVFMRRVMVENLDRFAPMRWITQKRKPGHKPTDEEKRLRILMMKKLREGDRRQVKILRRRLQKCMRQTRIKNFEEKVKTGKTDMWKAFKQITKKSKSDVVIIENNKRLVGNACADRFADFFSGKIKKLKSTCTPVTPVRKSDEQLASEGIEKFEFRLLKEKEIRKIIRDSKPSVATDMYGLSPKMMKHWAISKPFITAVTYVVNFCILSGKIPEEWKISKLYPCYKGKGSRHQTTSYRPIALGSPLIKVFEAGYQCSASTLYGKQKLPLHIPTWVS